MSPENTIIDIGVCTFRRPALEATLASLARLAVPQGWQLRVIVADNDDTPSARPLVERVGDGFPHALVYRHAPSRNISLARNACLDNAQGRFIAFIDDDETASPGWIAALLATALANGDDAVLGPVKAIYDPGAPQWMRLGDFHSTLPVHVGGRIVTGYTCNVLMDRAALRERRFDLALGRSGGEDTQFFTGLVQAGGQIGYAPDALVEEAVPAGRARFRWLAQRRFRMGQTHGRVVVGPGPLPRQALAVGKAMAKAGYCFALATSAVAAPQAGRRYALRGALHAGVVVGLMGMREIEQYGGPAHGTGAADAG